MVIERYGYWYAGDVICQDINSQVGDFIIPEYSGFSIRIINEKGLPNSDKAPSSIITDQSYI